MPAVVYHYTNADGLLGILRNRSIFATEKNFLNDKTEVTYGIDRASYYLRKIQESETNPDIGHLIDGLRSSIRIEGEARFFVFSMSERADDLSQWRGYANDGDGFTVGFDTNYLRKRTIEPEADFGFNKVTYAQYKLRESLGDYVKDFAKLLGTDLDTDYIIMCLDGVIESTATFFKHNSFRYEREWRILSAVYADSPEEVRVRSSSGRLIPYIEIPLCQPSETLPVVEIGIGPAVANPNAKTVVQDLCAWCGISPKIYTASTPFVRY